MTSLSGRRRAQIALAFLVLIGCLATCVASAPDADPPERATLGPSATPAQTSSSETTTPVPTPVARIRLNFAGDINFQDERAALLRADPTTVLSPIAGLLGDADLTVVNLETAITERGTPAPKAFTFRTSPDALVALRAAGVDVASIANNHGLDYGPVGVDDALAASKAKDFPLIGIGQNEAEAMRPFRTTIRDHRVAVIGATQVLDDNLTAEWTATPDHPGLASAKRVDALLAAVKAVRPTTDTLVVFLHWGIETHTCPSETQRTLASKLVEAGADIVVGGHAHRLQGAGRMDDAIVGYGLGNFAFYAGSEAAAQTGVLTVEVGGDQPASYQWQPARIGQSGIPVPLSGDPASAALRQWNGLRECTGLAP